ncbi:MAG: hypothetical protein JO097_18215 [Acidobacteriaceae bacterium]|nr:hypothetical protein [Acidobacteriaceae bacterium]
MKNLLFASLLGASLCCCGAFAEEVTGYISESHCGTAHSSPSAANTACVKKCLNGGSDPVLVSNGKIIKIDPASKDQAAAHAGENVTISGSMNGDSLKIDTIQTAK